MKFLAAVHSDVGIHKKKNQDSLCLKIAKLKNDDEVAMMIVCDGMGGLEKGELASATIIRAFAEWFDNEMPENMKNGFSVEDVKSQWEDIIKNQNELINEYGENHRLQLGTTLTALLIADGKFLISQVGDSRAYRITDIIEQVTEDQTVVQRDVKLGLITPEQAREDPRQNVLLQCIGASKVVAPVFVDGVVAPGEQYMLCSDGFRHKVNDAEILGVLASDLMKNEAIMKKSLIDLIELNKSRQERDNITATLIKVV